jgi:putative redox protein
VASPLEAKVTLIDGMNFRADSGTGYTLALDAADEAGGRQLGARPMELLIMGLGGCTGMDVISILRKMQQDVVSYEVSVRGERIEEHPKVFADIVVEHRVRGRNVTADRVRRAVELSATKYCPASAMLSKAASVTHNYIIIDEATGTEVHRGSLQE